MAVPFGGHPTIGDLAEWASNNGCNVALTVRQHAVTGQPYESLEISNPKGGRVAIAIPGDGERLEPSMVGYIQRRLGLKTPFAATPEPPKAGDTEFVHEDGTPFEPPEKAKGG